MSSPIAEAFCLKTGRRNFIVNVRASVEDRRVYFGRSHLNETLVQDLRQGYAMYGLYGSGKTHTLYNIQYHLQESDEAKTLPYRVRSHIIDCEFRKKMDFTYIYAQMLDAIGLEAVRDEIRRFLQEHATEDIEQLLRSRFLDGRVAKVVHNLGLGGNAVTLWRRLSGGALSSADLSTLELTKNLTPVGNMVSTLVALCSMYRERGEHQLFLLDEMEGLQNVADQDA
jgi:hypothetical protein